MVKLKNLVDRLLAARSHAERAIKEADESIRLLTSGDLRLALAAIDLVAHNGDEARSAAWNAGYTLKPVLASGEALEVEPATQPAANPA